MDVFQSKLDSLLAIKGLEVYSDDIVAKEEVLEQIRGSNSHSSNLRIQHLHSTSFKHKPRFFRATDTVGIPVARGNLLTSGYQTAAK
jgi:hypothetical protein